ncbi:PAS domain-containing protein [Methylobacillus sp. MM3]|jgi:hypothetical protein|uniref:PAS domain-containing protein n=1 Tax=Methylobacillus sp. MM3 TaxID=1848039 RepID=UPI0009ECDDA7|nr:PAS domain-containing protein [Methylobacillus sp. MM3]
MPILDLLTTKASPPPDLNDPEFQHSLINAIYEVSPNGILVVDARGTIVFHNPRFFEVWQLPAANKANHFIGMAVRWIATPQPCAAIRASIWGASGFFATLPAANRQKTSCARAKIASGKCSN